MLLLFIWLNLHSCGHVGLAACRAVGGELWGVVCRGDCAGGATGSCVVGLCGGSCVCGELCGGLCRSWGSCVQWSRVGGAV